MSSQFRFSATVTLEEEEYIAHETASCGNPPMKETEDLQETEENVTDSQ